jgi:hypothetical protein
VIQLLLLSAQHAFAFNLRIEDEHHGNKNHEDASSEMHQEDSEGQQEG